MTPRTLAVVLEGAAWRVQHEVRLATTQAWLTAAFSRQKKLPRLQKVLGDRKAEKAKPQTIQQQEAILRALHARLGGQLTSG
jgi:hypothetical protein